MESGPVGNNDGRRFWSASRDQTCSPEFLFSFCFLLHVKGRGVGSVANAEDGSIKVAGSGHLRWEVNL